MSKRPESDQEEEEAVTPAKKARMSTRQKMGDRAFKTPMTFSPRVNGELSRPSPSRVDLWREQLGLNDTNLQPDDGDSSNSDEEPEVDQNINKQTCSMVEYSALVKELEERESQRDDLRYRCKILLEKNNSYRTKLEKDEVSKKQQLKILTRTHQQAIQEKDRLIKSLEDLTAEQESRITELEVSVKGGTVPSSDPEDKELSAVRTLNNYIQDLQKEKSELLLKVMTLESNLEEGKVNTRETNEVQDSRLRILENENKQLKEEAIQLRSLRNPPVDGTKVCELEFETDRLMREIRNLKSQVDMSNESLKAQQDDNANLDSKITNLEEKIQQITKESKERENDLKEELQNARKEHQELEEKFQNTSTLLAALQAKSPEVVTKVQKVEVESEEAKSTIENLTEENIQQKNQLKESQDKLDTLRQEKESLKEELEQQLKESQNKLDHLRQEKESLKQELEGQLNTLKQEEGDHKQNINSLQTECFGLKEKLQTSEEQLNSTKQKNGDVQSELQTAKAQHKSLMEQIGQLTQQHSDEVQKLSEENANRLTQLEKEKMLEVLQLEDQKAVEMKQLRERLEAAAEERSEELRKSEREAVAKMAEMQQSYKAIIGSLKAVKMEAQRLKEEHRVLSEQCTRLPKDLKKEARKTSAQVVKAIEDINRYNQELATKYSKEMKLRKKYHNELVELKGNIRVFCRLRPKIKEDGSGPSAEIIARPDYDDDGVVNVLSKGRTQSFEMDRVFSPEVSQGEIFIEVQALVTSCIDGYNVCIFAYGQTGSGKTFTMEGTHEQPGINQRALQELFRETAERSSEWSYEIKVSMVEIYNETLRDLLNPDVNVKLEVKMLGAGLHIPGLQSEVVNSVADVNKVFKTGHRNRATASTNMNERSSRSHALLMIGITGCSKTTKSVTSGKLNLVDLAGSERVSKSGADGARLKEAQNINKSLSCIGDVIHALRTKQSHVPYRNSKLTYLLQDSLGGDSKTLMITQVSPVEKNVSETLATLGFAQRVRAVELGQASRRVETLVDGANSEDAGRSLRSRTPKK